MELIIILIFVTGYVLIALEHPIKINKAATALVTGVLCWALFALRYPSDTFPHSDNYLSFLSGVADLDVGDAYRSFIASELAHHLADISGILFFLLGAMTIVELIDAHQGFRFITDRIKTQDMRKLLWLVCWLAFFLSAVLDNLTTSIVMVSLTRKIIRDQQQRLFFAGMIIVAANAGGAWSPLGDVTTTMLWIGGQVTSTAIITQVFLPSVVCLLAPLILLSFRMKGRIETRTGTHALPGKPEQKGSMIMLCVGVGALIFVPIFKSITHLPPYMGMLIGLGAIWITSELINPDVDDSERKKLSAAHALSRIDISSILFFMGILLAVGALQSMQTLPNLAAWLDKTVSDNRIIITVIGAVSAIVDNVPLVAAFMGMYSLETYPADHMVWKYLAYCAGTGGSLLVIGSAAGIAVMGMEKLDFIWYLKNISLLALIGYIAGAATYLLLY